MKELSIIFPSYWPINDNIFKSYGGLETRSLAVAKLFADLDYHVNIIAPRDSHITHKNITVLSGNHRAWDGKSIHPYELEKDLVNENLDVLKNSDAILDDSIIGDTPVLIRENEKIIKVIPIEDLVPKSESGEHSIENTEVWTDEGWSKIKYVWKHKVHGTYLRIRTKKSFIELTKNHSLIKNNKKIFSGELNIGDTIETVPYKLPNEYIIDEDFAWLLGFFVAEGYAAKHIYKRTDRPRINNEQRLFIWEIYNQDIEPLIRSAKILEKYGITSRIDTVKNDNTRRLKMDIPQQWAIYFKKLCYSRYGHKIVPYPILMSNPQVQKSFVEGYWIGDGHVDEKGWDEKCNSESKALLAGLALIFDNLKRDYSIIYHKYRNCAGIHLNKLTHNNQTNICDIQEVEINKAIGNYVYDIETKNHHFCCGIGQVLAHNTHFHPILHLKSLSPNEFPLIAFSYDHHPDNLTSLPAIPCNIIAVSKWVMMVLRQKFKNQNHRFFHAYSGLILENYPSEFNPKNKEDNLYLFLARFSSVKAPHVCLELAKENPTDNFILLGDCLFSNEPYYARKIKDIGDNLDNVKVIFNCSYKEKIDYLQRATGLLHPGFWDGPLEWDILEGLYFGAKALCFDRGATREIYKSDEHGLIAPFSNNEAQNIEVYKKAFRLFKKMKIKPEVCRQRVLDNFDFKIHSFPKYEEVLFNIKNLNPKL